MHSRFGVFYLIFFLFCFNIFGNLSAATLLQDLEVTPELILLRLPQEPGQEYKVSTTQNPMKVIIDCTLPLTGFTPNTKVNDVVLKEVRYSKFADGTGRLVLDFHYHVPTPLLVEDKDYLQVNIAKTYANTSERMVIPGVIYGHQRRADTFGPNVVNYLLCDLGESGIEVRLALAQNRVFGSEHVSTIGERLGAIAAVNGAFFAADGRPLGLFAIDGELVSEPYAKRTAIGWGDDVVVMDGVDFKGEILCSNGLVLVQITGLNRPRLEDDLIIYTHHFGTKTNTNIHGIEVTVVDGVVTNIQTGDSPIPPQGLVLSGHGISKIALGKLSVGEVLEIQMELTPAWLEQGVRQIIGGGPRLVRDGALWLTGLEERFQDDVLLGRAPRTALGITADGKLLLVTVNGRQPRISVGMSLEELGMLLLELGAVQAMNLDGGGSTTMVIRDLVLNLPSDGKERPVSNALVVLPPQQVTSGESK